MKIYPFIYRQHMLRMRLNRKSILYLWSVRVPIKISHFIYGQNKLRTRPDGILHSPSIGAQRVPVQFPPTISGEHVSQSNLLPPFTPKTT